MQGESNKDDRATTKIFSWRDGIKYIHKKNHASNISFLKQENFIALF